MSYETDRYQVAKLSGQSLAVIECGIQICHGGHVAQRALYRDYSIHFILEGKGNPDKFLARRIRVLTTIVSMSSKESSTIRSPPLLSPFLAFSPIFPHIPFYGQGPSFPNKKQALLIPFSVPL